MTSYDSKGSARPEFAAHGVTGSSHAAQDDPLGSLTQRQREVFLLMGEGKSCAEIARVLRTSRSNVTRHRNNLMCKLHLATRASLLQLAVRVRVGV